MNRFDKDMKLKGLKALMDIKKKEIIKKENELKTLEELYQYERISDMPILMYKVTHTNTNLINDLMYEYIYYLPDFNEIVMYTSYEDNDFLVNTLDLRDLFSQVNIPRTINHNEVDIQSEYKDHIEYSKNILNNIINEIFVKFYVPSWNDVRYYLETLQTQYEVPIYFEKVDTDNPRYLKRKY